MEKFKKPKYIRKYDYIRTFYRSKDEWFWPTELLKKFIKWDTSTNIDEELEESAPEFDVLDFFKEQKDEQKFEDMNLNDPKIYEGNLIDQKAKKFIVNEFFKDINVEIVDFDDYKKIYNLEQQYNKTIQYIKNNENIVLFQPCLIWNNIAIAKPDAIVIKNKKIILIETKGTTSTKPVHNLDIIYQSKICNWSLAEINRQIDDYRLCLVKYELLDKHGLSFILTNIANINSSNIKEEQSDEDDNNNNNKFKDEQILLKQCTKLCYSSNEVTFKMLVNNQFDFPKKKMERSAKNI